MDGGILMGPFLLLVLLWGGSTLKYFSSGRRSRKMLFLLAAFPLGFGHLAIANWALHWHAVYREFGISGAMDPVIYSQTSLMISRSTLVVVSTAGFSLVSWVLAVWASPVPDEPA